jgi:hypothetical protein
MVSNLNLYGTMQLFKFDIWISFDISNFDSKTKLKMFEWCFINLGDAQLDHHINPSLLWYTNLKTISFKNSHDATIFKLVWF